MEEPLRIGDFVTVPDPQSDDLHTHSFDGVIVYMRDNLSTVEDQDGKCFEIETNRLQKANDQL